MTAYSLPYEASADEKLIESAIGNGKKELLRLKGSRVNQMKKLITMIMMIALVLVAGSSFAQGTKINALVSVDNAFVEAGEQFSVKVRLSNNSFALGALDIPLRFSSPDLTLDSVSFVSSISVENFPAMIGTINQVQAVRIIYLPEVTSPIPTLSASQAVLGELFFSVATDAAQQVITIDSVYETTIPQIMLTFSSTTGETTYLPKFEIGTITVGSPTAVDDDNDGLLPNNFSLGQNYPNPFNPTTRIEFSIPQAGNVSVEIFNVLGQKATSLVDRQFSAGQHIVEFDASEFPSGIYFYRLKHNQGTLTKKMVLMK